MNDVASTVHALVYTVLLDRHRTIISTSTSKGSSRFFCNMRSSGATRCSPPAAPTLSPAPKKQHIEAVQRFALKTNPFICHTYMVVVFLFHVALWQACASVKWITKDLPERTHETQGEGAVARLTAVRLNSIAQRLRLDSIHMTAMSETPYMRLGFHVAASYDSVSGRGGWNDLGNRDSMVTAGLADNILIAYWDVLEQYYETNVNDLHPLTKADFLSFVIYMYMNNGIFTPNVTWRAGRATAPEDAGNHMLSGRPDMSSGSATSFKPEGNMTDPQYLREYFGRLGITDDRDVVLLMSAHAVGAARGLPYLGEFNSAKIVSASLSKDWDSSSNICCGMGACYYYDNLYLEWKVGCPTTCNACSWYWTAAKIAQFDPFDPYNTTWNFAPSNYTDEAYWGDACTESLRKLDLFCYTDKQSSRVLRLPVELSMLEDPSYRSIMEGYVKNSDDDRSFVLEFGKAYSKMLEVGVPPGSLYHVEGFSVSGSTPPFSSGPTLN